MELTESQKSEVANALRTVKTKKVASQLGLTFTAHKNHSSIFHDNTSDAEIKEREVELPHWLIDRLHKQIV
jgi:hypothetical protein